MANSPRSTSPDPAEAVRKAANSPAAHDVKDDLASLRADLARLSDTVTSLLGGQADQVKGLAADKANELYASDREALRTAETRRDERRVGEGCVSTCRTRVSPYP